MRTLPHKVEVVGTGISAATIDEVVSWVLDPPASGLAVAITNVHAVMTAQRDPALATALANAEIATTDGMPLAWALRAMGCPDQRRVDGHSVTKAVIEAGLERDTAHFFYGSTPETLASVVANLRRDYPAIRIVGTYSPPFGRIDPDEQQVLQVIRDSQASVVWVGLGVPRQEQWIDSVRNHLPGLSLVGVGAVFDWLAGNIPKAPGWMQRSGLEWAYRLGKEPRRLWRRYIWNNPSYVFKAGRQVLAHRLKSTTERTRSE